MIIFIIDYSLIKSLIKIFKCLPFDKTERTANDIVCILANVHH